MSEETRRLSRRKVNPEILEFSGLFLGIFFIALTSIYNYLLFHSVAEIFSIIIAGGVFFVGWNSRKYMNNSFFLVFGVSSLFIGIIDLIHTLSYSGMPIFTGFDANLPTSLWIAARYLQSCSLLFASLLIKRSIKSNYLFVAYMGIFIILTILIFNNAFPVCYIEGIGLTPFKIISEYIINLILLSSLLIIIKNRTEFDKKVLLFIIGSTVAVMIAELAFTFYIGVSDFSNLVGHIFKIIAFYLIYKAIIQIGIEEPFSLLFRKIKRSELELENVIKHSGAGITMLNADGHYLLVNEKAASELGGKPEDFIGKTLYDVFPNKLAEEYFNSNRELIQNGITRSYQRTFDLPTGQKTFWITEQPLTDIDEKYSSLLSVSTDITERMKSEELLKEAEQRYRTTFEQSPDGIIILDLDTFKAVEFNDAVCKMLGYTREEFEKLQINDYDVTENPSETREHIEKVLKEGRDDFETKFRTKNGEIKDIYVTAKVITLLRKTYFQSIFRDITGSKRAEEEIKRREYDLKERVKELTCLYNISKLVEQMDISIEEVLERVLFYIPPAWQYPEITCARLFYKGLELKMPNFKETEWVLKTDIKEYGNSIGSIEVFYLERKPKIDEGPFFKEERYLINGISEMIGIFSERKQAEERIRNLSRFPSENPNPVLRVDKKKVLYTNRIGQKFFNIEEGSWIPQFLETTTKYVLNNNKIQELELKANNRIYTLVITPVENEEYANIYGMDITERKQAEERIRNLSRFPSENPNPVLRVDKKKVLYTNRIGQKFFNIEEGSWIPQFLETTTKYVLNNNKIQELELKANNRIYTLVITPVENEEYANIYGMDITERKQAEQRLSQLISTVSHELRTPITVLLMSIEYLTKHKETLTEELEEKLIEGISRNIQLLNQLAEDILLISRIDEHRFELEWKKFKPLDVINEILYLMEPIGKEKLMNFEVDVDNTIELHGDPKRIDQVFRIIIDNAIKYSPENSKVEIRAIENYQGKYNVNQNSGTLFQFQDYGRGIPKEDLPKIFERFFRSSNVNEVSGTGLGLAIAKEIIEAHNGNIIVESELDKGTRIHVFLPQSKY